ncbi:MAG: hypothetical protein FJZ60_04845 [Chlamydiae bacterium]|nr:hypothetical protein [Chlamydiota bacterium]
MIDQGYFELKDVGGDNLNIQFESARDFTTLKTVAKMKALVENFQINDKEMSCTISRKDLSDLFKG